MKPDVDHKRSAAHLKKHLVALTKTVRASIKKLDATMKLPESSARGSAIARILNEIEMANDQARHFGLDISLRADRPTKGGTNS